MARLDGQFIRVVAPQYASDWQVLERSGLRERLTADGLLIPHQELGADLVPGALKVLLPKQLSFVSYPYEWCFSQWREAALATLQVQEQAVACGMTLKDASAFNIQFLEGKPVLIDLLSFEQLQPRPWPAYAQFCRHFLAPLALIACRDGRLGQLLRGFLDGVPLDMASRLLPASTYFKPALLLHLHLHAGSQRWLKPKRPIESMEGREYSRKSLLGLVYTLRAAISNLRYKPRRDVWANYYPETVLGGGYVEGKQRIFTAWIDEISRQQSTGWNAWDLGANTGLFSRLLAKQGANVVSFDGDIDCVELAWRDLRQRPESRLLPLCMDLANPSPAIGWAHCERLSWLERGEPSLVTALALIHHLAIGNNVPLPRLASFFAQFSPTLIIEFVPKNDANAQKLFTVRADIFPNYTQTAFETEFRRWFRIERAEPLPGSERVLYLMRRERKP